MTIQEMTTPELKQFADAMSEIAGSDEWADDEIEAAAADLEAAEWELTRRGEI